MRWARAMAITFGAIVLSLVCAFLGLRYLFLGRLTLPTVQEYENMAKTGLPLVQAITDYRIDRGLLPETLDDLVPQYWSTKSNIGWKFNSSSISHYAGIPHTYVYYWFDGGNSNEWWIRGESKNIRLNVPSPSYTRTGPTGESLFAVRLDEYERRIKKKPSEKQTRADKINFLASEKREDLLRIECAKAAKDFPSWWFPQMALATLDKNAENARADFEKWVNEHPSFVNFWYLGRYHRELGNTAATLRALERTTEYSFQAYPNDASWVGAAFAFDAAKFAYEQRQFDLTRQICERWGSLGASYGEKSWLAFQAAAELSLGHCESAAEHARQALKANAEQAMWAENLSELLRQTELRNTNFVYRAGNTGSEWSLYSDPSP